MGKDVPLLSRKEFDLLKAKVESVNGNRMADFNLKEIMLMLTQDIKVELKISNKKLERTITCFENERIKVNKSLSDHDVCLARISENFKHIAETLPAKGFCEKVEKTLYTKEGLDKVETLWNDRRWMKGLFALAIGLLGVGSLNLIFSLMGV